MTRVGEGDWVSWSGFCQGKGDHFIDYSGADEFAPGNFEHFYKSKLEEQKFMEEIPGSQDKLTPGAAMQRAAHFFRVLITEFMYPDEHDRDAILNSSAVNPDLPFLEDCCMPVLYRIEKGKWQGLSSKPSEINFQFFMQPSPVFFATICLHKCSSNAMSCNAFLLSHHIYIYVHRIIIIILFHYTDSSLYHFLFHYHL